MTLTVPFAPSLSRAAPRLSSPLDDCSYPPSYMDLMRRREQIPKVIKDTEGKEMVVLLKEEEGKGANSKGRPVGPQYWDRAEKVKFMDTHGIDVSVVSLANPWLDFLEPAEAVDAARVLNDDMQKYCETYGPEEAAASTSYSAQTQKRLFAFGSLPLVPGISSKQVIQALEQIKGLSYLRGIVMGTKGIGKGLDDPEMEPIYEAIAASGLVVFVVRFLRRRLPSLSHALTRLTAVFSSRRSTRTTASRTRSVSRTTATLSPSVSASPSKRPSCGPPLSYPTRHCAHPAHGLSPLRRRPLPASSSPVSSTATRRSSFSSRTRPAPSPRSLPACRPASCTTRTSRTACSTTSGTTSARCISTP